MENDVRIKAMYLEDKSILLVLYSHNEDYKPNPALPDIEEVLSKFIKAVKDCAINKYINSP